MYQFALLTMGWQSCKNSQLDNYNAEDQKVKKNTKCSHTDGKFVAIHRSADGRVNGNLFMIKGKV